MPAGRPIKMGLDFFPEVVTPDDSFSYVEARFPVIGYVVVRKLWRKIYKNGYYCEWNDRVKFTFSEEIKITPEIIQEILDVCFAEDLFSKEMLDKYSILTSSGVQWRWKLIVHAAKRQKQDVDPRYNLMKKNRKKIGSIPEEIQLTPEEKPINSGGNSHRKNQQLNTAGGNSINSGGNSINSGNKKEEIPQSKTLIQGNTINSITLGGDTGNLIQEKKQEPPAAHSADEKELWAEAVKVWFAWNLAVFKRKPSFKGPDPKNLKAIQQNLRQRDEEQLIVWTVARQKQRLWAFFDAAYKDPFLKKSFILKNIEQKFDTVELNMIEVAGQKEQVQDDDIQYLYERYKENKLGLGLIEQGHINLIINKTKITATEDLWNHCRKVRGEQLISSVQASDKEIAKAYLGNIQNEFTDRDKPSLLLFVQKMMVSYYFQGRAKDGAEKWL